VPKGGSKTFEGILDGVRGKFVFREGGGTGLDATGTSRGVQEGKKEGGGGP